MSRSITSFFGGKPGAGGRAAAAAKAKSGDDWAPQPLPDEEDVEWGALERHLEPTWAGLLAGEFKKPYWRELGEFLEREAAAGTQVFPPRSLVFNAFRLTPFDRVRCVVIGQDPYHDDGQAEGMSFSVPHGVRVPSSLRNIYKELGTDVAGFRAPAHGHLARWAEQGVLLLNYVLTVRAHSANSHRGKGWETLTREAVRALSAREEPVVFMLWGKQAQAAEKLINTERHKVLKCAHPSGLSAHRGFFGCKHFSKANSLLRAAGYEPIDWNLPPAGV